MPIRRIGGYKDGATATSVEVAVGAGGGCLGQVEELGCDDEGEPAQAGGQRDQGQYLDGSHDELSLWRRDRTALPGGRGHTHRSSVAHNTLSRR